MIRMMSLLYAAIQFWICLTVLACLIKGERSCAITRFLCIFGNKHNYISQGMSQGISTVTFDTNLKVNKSFISCKVIIKIILNQIIEFSQKNCL